MSDMPKSQSKPGFTPEQAKLHLIAQLKEALLGDIDAIVRTGNIVGDQVDLLQFDAAWHSFEQIGARLDRAKQLFWKYRCRAEAPSPKSVRKIRRTAKDAPALKEAA
jgi:hypothetical protein